MALLMGQWGQQEAYIDMPLRRNRMQGGERLVQVDESGKQSQSVFSVVREYPNRPKSTGSSLMKIRLITGRTHQIRVHGAELGHPIAGDDRYGDQQYNSQMKSFGLRRMFLHASALSFPHPDNGQTMRIEPPLDDDLQLVLDQLAA